MDYCTIVLAPAILVPFLELLSSRVDGPGTFQEAGEASSVLPVWVIIYKRAYSIGKVVEIAIIKLWRENI
jgi:hypothetical protein